MHFDAIDPRPAERITLVGR